MKSRNPDKAEAGFSALAAIASVSVQERTDAFEAEERLDLRCWLLELISVARSPQAFETLCKQTQSEHEALRNWAIWGITELNTKEARTFPFENGLRR